MNTQSHTSEDRPQILEQPKRRTPSKNTKSSSQEARVRKITAAREAKEAKEQALFEEECMKFMTPGYPQVLPNGQIPLRVQIFNNKKILRNVISKPKKGVYMCNHCDLLFTTFGDLLDHFDEFQIKRVHKCTHDDCPWSIVGFNKSRQFQRHMNTIHSLEKEYACSVPECNKTFARMDLLSRHVKSVHENENSRFNVKKLKTASDSTSSVNSLRQDSPSSHINIDSLLNTTTSPKNSPSSTTTPELKDETSTSTSTSTSISTDSNNQSQRDHNYKHSIKFLTNQD